MVRLGGGSCGSRVDAGCSLCCPLLPGAVLPSCPLACLARALPWHQIRATECMVDATCCRHSSRLLRFMSILPLNSLNISLDERSSLEREVVCPQNPLLSPLRRYPPRTGHVSLGWGGVRWLGGWKVAHTSEKVLCVGAGDFPAAGTRISPAQRSPGKPHRVMPGRHRLWVDDEVHGGGWLLWPMDDTVAEDTVVL